MAVAICRLVLQQKMLVSGVAAAPPYAGTPWYCCLFGAVGFTNVVLTTGKLQLRALKKAIAAGSLPWHCLSSVIDYFLVNVSVM
jgi:hypothetical protein